MTDSSPAEEISLGETELVEDILWAPRIDMNMDAGIGTHASVICSSISTSASVWKHEGEEDPTIAETG